MRIGQTIYLDHNATTPVDPRVLARMLPFFGEKFGNPHSVDHAFGWEAARAVEEAAAHVAGLIRADVDEVIFTSGATEANNLALLGLIAGRVETKRCRVLLTSIDHKSSLALGRAMEQRGFVVTLLRVDKAGHLDLEHLSEQLQGDVLLLSICLVNSEIGTIQNLSEAASLVRPYEVLVHCDAAQAPCAINVNNLTDWADLISLSAHKMYGPKGIGALYVRRSVQHLIEPIIYGGGQQRNLRSGTLPTPLCVGFGAAAELLNPIVGEQERERVRQLRDLFVNELLQLPWPVALNGDMTFRHPGNANLRFEGFSAEDLLGVLQPRLAASTGSACTSGISEPSYVLRAIGLSYEQAAASIRFCVGRYTTDADIREAVGLLSESLQKIGCQSQTPCI
jgi:cysteine desulfurase